MELVDKLQPGAPFGRYIIKEVLGEGGMGVVYAAYDPTLHRKIAIKVLRVSSSSGEDPQLARARMLREAQAMAMCGHQNLVRVFDVGTFQDEIFIAMEFVEGVTLRKWRQQSKPPWVLILSKYVDAARGLASAHKRHLVHRDFKPENVLVDDTGHVRVMDFGLARHTGGKDASTTMETPAALVRPLTQTGMIMGTPAYMAPEQFLAEPANHRSDQFSFCVALFEALYGYRPYEGDSMKILARNVIRGSITLPPKNTQVPDHVLTALLKGLQTDPDDRHDNMDLLIDELTIAPDTSTHNAPWIITIIALLATLFGGALYWYTADEDPPKDFVPESLVFSQGIITDEQMQEVVNKHQEDIDDCVAQGRKRTPELAGKISLKFEISVSGGKVVVERSFLENTDLEDQRTARCILGMSMNWEFPSPSCPGDSECRAEIKTQIIILAIPNDSKNTPGK